MRFLTFALFVFLSSRIVQACSCGRYPSATEARDSAVAVFEGTVVNRWPQLIPIDFPDTNTQIPSQRYTFAVTRVWKGPTESQITILEGSGNCSERFETGKTYLVFATPHETEAGSLGSYKCAGPTGDSSRAASHIAALGQPVVTFPQAPRVQHSWRYRAQQHVAVYFWTGIAVMKFAVRRPLQAGWRINVVLAGALVITMTLIYLIHRKVKPPVYKATAFVVAVFALSVVTVIASGFFYIRNNGWFQHLLEGWSPL